MAVTSAAKINMSSTYSSKVTKTADHKDIAPLTCRSLTQNLTGQMAHECTHTGLKNQL